jgi:hypothetical protein
LACWCCSSSSDGSDDSDRRGKPPPELLLGVEGERRPLLKSGVGVKARDRGVEASCVVQDGGDDRAVTAVRELLVEAVVVKVVIEDSLKPIGGL